MMTSPAAIVPRGVSTDQPVAVCVSLVTGVFEAIGMPRVWHEIEQALEIEGRVKMRGARHHHAAAIIVGADLLALALLRHQIGIGLCRVH